MDGERGEVPCSARLIQRKPSGTAAIRLLSWDYPWPAGIVSGCSCGSRLAITRFVRTTESETAAAVRIGTRLAARERGELLGLLRDCFARPEPHVVTKTRFSGQ
jgi:hypothetical protein